MSNTTQNIENVAKAIYDLMLDNMSMYPETYFYFSTEKYEDAKKGAIEVATGYHQYDNEQDYPLDLFVKTCVSALDNEYENSEPAFMKCKKAVEQFVEDELNKSNYEQKFGSILLFEYSNEINPQSNGGFEKCFAYLNYAILDEFNIAVQPSETYLDIQEWTVIKLNRDSNEDYAYEILNCCSNLFLYKI
jgi:hypothetical protein